MVRAVRSAGHVFRLMLGNGEMPGKTHEGHQRGYSKTHLATSTLAGSELDEVALVRAH